MRGYWLLGVVALVAGCSLSGGDSAAIEAGELEQLVLQPEDVPRGFQRFDEGRRGNSETAGGPGGEGWKARYRRPGTPQTEGPLVISSVVDRFESESDAAEGLAEQRAALTEGELEWEPVGEPELGDESLAMAFEQTAGASRVAFFVVAWRDANVTASVEANGFAGKVALADAIELARRQAARIQRAA
jgi:hypothetical protein